MGLIDRAKNIIVQPRAEWSVIDTEPATVGGLYTGYVIPLSLLSVICATLGMVLFGISVPFLGNIRYPLGTALGSAAVRFVAGLISIYVIALVIDALAPTFGGTKNSIQAFKVAAYSYTAAWVFGVLAIIPALAIIAGLLGLYSLYLLYTGFAGAHEVAAGESTGLHRSRHRRRHRPVHLHRLSGERARVGHPGRLAAHDVMLR